jgi:hypothetical protein
VNAIDKEELNFKPDRQMPRVAPWCSLGLNTEIARAHLRLRIPFHNNDAPAGVFTLK